MPPRLPTGPPSSAHGGSVFAVFEHAALHACAPSRPPLPLPAALGRVGSEQWVQRCAVTYKNRVPLQTDLRLEVAVQTAVAQQARHQHQHQHQVRTSRGESRSRHTVVAVVAELMSWDRATVFNTAELQVVVADTVAGGRSARL